MLFTLPDQIVDDYIIIGLIGAAILVFIQANVASSKGRSFGAWYVYGFPFWIVAVIHAASLEPNHYCKNNCI